MDVKIQNLKIQNLSIISSGKFVDPTHVIQNISFEILNNQIVSIIGNSFKEKSSLSHAIAGLIPSVADILQVGNVDVINYSNYNKYKTHPGFRKLKEVNYISAQRILEFDIDSSPISYLSSLIRNRDFNQLESLRNSLGIDFSYLFKILNMNNAKSSSVLEEPYFKFIDLYKKFLNLISKNIEIQSKDDISSKYEEVYKTEREYVQAIERIRESITLLQIDLKKYGIEFMDKVNLKFTQEIEYQKYQIELLKNDRYKKILAIKSQFKSLKDETLDEFSNVQKALLKERHEFFSKTFNDEKLAIEAEYNEKINFLVNTLKKANLEYKLEKNRTNEIIKTKLKSKFKNEILSKTSSLKALLKKFVVERKKILKKSITESKKQKNSDSSVLKIIYNDLTSISKQLQTQKPILVDLFNSWINSQDPTLKLKNRANEIILEWKKIQSILANNKLKMTKRNSKLHAISFLLEVDFDINLMHKSICDLSIENKFKVLLATTYFNNAKLTILENVYKLLPSNSRAKFSHILIKIANVYNNSILLLDDNLCSLWDISNYIYIIHKGKFVEHGTCDEIKNNPVHPLTKMIRSHVFTLDEAITNPTFQRFHKDQFLVDQTGLIMLKLENKDHFVLTHPEKGEIEKTEINLPKYDETMPNDGLTSELDEINSNETASNKVDSSINLSFPESNFEEEDKQFDSSELKDIVDNDILLPKS